MKDDKKEKHGKKSQKFRVKEYLYVSMNSLENPVKWLMGMDILSTPKILKIYNKLINLKFE